MTDDGVDGRTLDHCNFEIADLRYIQLLPVQGVPVAGEPDGLAAVLAARNFGCLIFGPFRLPFSESNQFL